MGLSDGVDGFIQDLEWLVLIGLEDELLGVRIRQDLEPGSKSLTNSLETLMTLSESSSMSSWEQSFASQFFAVSAAFP